MILNAMCMYTALISIMLPILYEVAQKKRLHKKTGIDAVLIMMVATACAFYAFMLPIATPTNAIVMSSGAVSIKAMAAYGVVFNILGIVLIVAITHTFWRGML